jgi:hypothetical protein
MEKIFIFFKLTKMCLFSDRGDLQDKDHVEELQATLLHVFYKHLKYYRPDGPDLFFKMLKLIPSIQELNRKHSEALNTVQMSHSSSNRSNSNMNGVHAGANVRKNLAMI